MGRLNSFDQDPKPRHVLGRQPCIKKCAGCVKQFYGHKDGPRFCKAYQTPAVMWGGRACHFMSKPVAQKEEKSVNPMKASRRQRKKATARENREATAKQASTTTAPAYSFEEARRAARAEAKKNKKK